MPIFEVNNLTKTFDSFTAVDHITFSLKKGEILGLLGPNGAGKTTTIQMLLGILTPTSGTISYFGKSFRSHREAILEKVNFTSTYTQLPLDLTVKEVLLYTSYFYRIKNRADRVKVIAELFHLEKLLRYQILELSAGQLTRVNLAKAFINFPQILLLDEPTASLDPESARLVREFFLKQQTKFNVSIIITSHNMAEVQEVCDRVVFINHGKIIANDTPQQLAQSIRTVQLELRIKGNAGLKQLKAVCEKRHIVWLQEGVYVNITIPEQSIAPFLADLARQHILYDEISIEKPTLEDYFFPGRP